MGGKSRQGFQSKNTETARDGILGQNPETAQGGILEVKPGSKGLEFWGLDPLEK